MTASVQITLMDHVRELRRRLFWCVGVFFAGGLAAYAWRGEIIQFLQAPLNQQLYYTSPAGSFNVIMQVCSIIGIILALPLLVFHLMRFIEPALSRPLPRRLIVGTMAGSFVLALGGAAVAFYLSLPVALQFFSTVGAGQLQALISVDQYFRFVFTYMSIFAIVFQLPLVLMVIDNVSPLGPGTLGKWRRYVIVGAFLVGLLTPTTPDPLSQLILALPIILLYELTIIAIWIKSRKRQRAQLTVEPLPVQAVAPTPPPAPPRAKARPLVASPVLDLRGTQPKYFRPASVNVLDLRIQK